MREEGLIVYGFGERKTPDAFVQACDKFIYTEVLRAEPLPTAPAKTRSSKPAKAPAKTAAKAAARAQGNAAADIATSAPTPASTAPAKPAVLPLPLELLRRAIEEASDEQGWAHLGAVGTYLTKIRPDFDPRLYGHKKLSDLLKSHPRYFAVEERGGTGVGSKSIYVRSLG
jgi:hypothetical protein